MPEATGKIGDKPPRIRGLIVLPKGWTFVFMNEQTRNSVLAKLASTDVASGKHRVITVNAAAENTAAITRLQNTYGINEDAAERLLGLMVGYLQESDLTVNFRVSKLFTSKLKGGLMNIYQTGTDQAGYMETRNRAEDTLFNYTNSAIDRVRRFGRNDDTNVDFVPSMRPKYGALNYTKNRKGSAHLYGHSFFILKDHVKHNCTYTDQDSFGYGSHPAGGSKVASFLNMDRLIINMSPAMLENIFRMINSPQARMTATHYIEAQIHGEVWFSRDIKEMHIDNMERDTTPGSRILIEKFARKNGILLKYI
jgi:hypothetical protein